MVCSDKWKLDKIDKIGISIIFIFATIFCFLDTFCNAAFLVPYSKIENVSIVNDKISNGNGYIYYFPIEEGHEYQLSYVVGDIAGGSNMKAYTTADVEIGSVVYNLGYIGNNYKFTAQGDYDWFVFYCTNDKYSVALNDLSETGIQNAVSKLSNQLSSDVIWGVFGKSIPFLLVIILISLSFYIIFKLIIGSSKGKARL